MTFAEDASRILATYQQDVDRLKRSPRFSIERNREDLALIWVEATNEIRQLQVDYIAGLAAERTGLQRRIFRSDGGDAQQMSYRDALGRVEQLKSDDQAVALLERGELTGDSELSRAVLTIAIERGWHTAVNRYIHHHPELDEPITRLWDVNHELNDFLTYLRLGLEAPDPELPGGLTDAGTAIRLANAVASKELRLVAKPQPPGGDFSVSPTRRPIPVNEVADWIGQGYDLTPHPQPGTTPVEDEPWFVS